MAATAALLATSLGESIGLAQTNASPTAWRDAVRSWCGDGTLTECRSSADLDPGIDGPAGARAAFTVANLVVHVVTPLLLEGVDRPRIATSLRASVPITDSASAASALEALRDAYDAMLPPRARVIARRFRPESWWTDAIDAHATPRWRSSVRDGDSRVGMAREAILLAAQAVALGAQGDADAARVFDLATGFATQAIERGAPRNDVIREFMHVLQDIPRRPRVVVAAAAGPTDIPTREQVIAALDAIRPAVEQCVGVQDVVAQVRFVFDSSGRVSEATVLGALAGSLAGSCVRTVASGATVPRFARASFSVSYPFNVRRASGTPAPPPVAVAPQPANPPPEPAPAPEPQRAAPEPAPERQPAPQSASSGSQDRPSDSQVAGSIAAIDPAVRACVSGRRGVAAVSYVVSNDGLVQRATATGPFDADARACIEGAVMNAQFPRFTQPSVSLSHRFQLR